MTSLALFFVSLFISMSGFMETVRQITRLHFDFTTPKGSLQVMQTRKQKEKESNKRI